MQCGIWSSLLPPGISNETMATLAWRDTPRGDTCCSSAGTILVNRSLRLKSPAYRAPTRHCGGARSTVSRWRWHEKQSLVDILPPSLCGPPPRVLCDVPHQYSLKELPSLQTAYDWCHAGIIEDSFVSRVIEPEESIIPLAIGPCDIGDDCYDDRTLNIDNVSWVKPAPFEDQMLAKAPTATILPYIMMVRRYFVRVSLPPTPPLFCAFASNCAAYAVNTSTWFGVQIYRAYICVVFFYCFASIVDCDVFFFVGRNGLGASERFHGVTWRALLSAGVSTLLSLRRTLDTTTFL